MEDFFQIWPAHNILTLMAANEQYKEFRQCFNKNGCMIVRKKKSSNTKVITGSERSGKQLFKPNVAHSSK